MAESGPGSVVVPVPTTVAADDGWKFRTSTITMSNIITFLGTLISTYYLIHPARTGTPPAAHSPAADGAVPVPADRGLNFRVITDADSPEARSLATYVERVGVPCVIVQDRDGQVVAPPLHLADRSEIVALARKIRGQ